MRKLLLCLALVVSPMLNAQPTRLFELTRTMRCSDVQELINDLTENYGEKMIWTGKDTSTATYISIYKNEKTGSWTLIQYDSKVGCVLGAGELGTPI